MPWAVMFGPFKTPIKNCLAANSRAHRDRPVNASGVRSPA